MKASDITMHNTLTSMPSASIPVHSLRGTPSSPAWSGQGRTILIYFLIISTFLFLVYLAYVRFLETQKTKEA